MITFADKNDSTQLAKMWQSIFLEDEKVTDYFFNNIYNSVITPVIRIENEIVSSLFLLDCNISDYKGKCIYCAMTKYAHRGKGYMKKLLDFSYDYCKENGFDFLFLVPAEISLFDYYAKCGFEKFGIHRKHIFDGNTPDTKEKLDFQYKIDFGKAIYDYWKNSCVVYGGEISNIGLCFDDDNLVIRNAECDYTDIPEKHKKENNVIQGNITFGEDYSPAMIKSIDEKIKNINCYIGITLE